MAKKEKLGGRRAPIRPMKRKALTFGFASEEDIPRPTVKRPRRKKGRRTPTDRRNERAVKRARARHPKTKTIKVGIKVGAETLVVSVPQSVRGAFEEGTERLVDSTIIHFLLYEPEKQALYVQLTAAGEWRDYTYFNVSLRQFEAFRDAPSKGRHFNRNIRNTQKWGFQHKFSRGKHI